MTRLRSILSESGCFRASGAVSGRQILFGDDDEGIGDGAFVAVTGIVSNPAIVPKGGGTAAVEVHRLGATQLDEEIGQFTQGHSHGTSLTAIHLDQVVAVLAPANGGAR